METERRLARRLRDARAAGWLTREEDGGYLTPELDAIVEEMFWVSEREREHEAMERLAARQDSRRAAQRKQAASRKARLLRLLALLKQSRERCTCHDFAYWYPLWQCDADLAQRLLLAGHHFLECAISAFPWSAEDEEGRGHCYCPESG